MFNSLCLKRNGCVVFDTMVQRFCNFQVSSDCDYFASLDSWIQVMDILTGSCFPIVELTEWMLLFLHGLKA